MKLRISTFNLENLDDKSDRFNPTLEKRLAVLKPQLLRLNADIICFQEVHGQERPGQPRQLLSLQELLQDTPYKDYQLISTLTTTNTIYDVRNLVIASRFPIQEHFQYRNDLIDKPAYKKVTEIPAEGEAEDIIWERPLLHAVIQITAGFKLHLINVHLKSKNPTSIRGQQDEQKYYIWKSASGWAEGFFVSSMKRVGQALETRMLIDQIFDAEPEANILVCGDFNANPTEVPVEAIMGRIENTGNPELVQRELVSGENSIPESSRYTYLYLGKKNLLDHILFSRMMLPYYVGSEIHNETLKDESAQFANDVKFPESDHAPFTSEFVIPD